MSEERRFTLEEANALVPLIQAQMDAGTTAREQLVRSAKQISERASGNGGASTPPIAPDAEATLASVIEQITDLGVILRDLDSGLVDFPTDRAGETVYLCWRSGETQIDFWHTVESGFGGRRPLAEL